MNTNYEKIVLCNKCGETKPISAFYKKELNKKSDTAVRCVSCAKKTAMEWRVQNRELYLEHKRKYYKKNKDKAIREYYEKNKDSINAYSKDRQSRINKEAALWRKFGGLLNVA